MNQHDLDDYLISLGVEPMEKEAGFLDHIPFTPQRKLYKQMMRNGYGGDALTRGQRAVRQGISNAHGRISSGSTSIGQSARELNQRINPRARMDSAVAEASRLSPQDLKVDLNDSKTPQINREFAQRSQAAHQRSQASAIANDNRLGGGVKTDAHEGFQTSGKQRAGHKFNRFMDRHGKKIGAGLAVAGAVGTVGAGIHAMTQKRDRGRDDEGQGGGGLKPGMPQAPRMLK